MDIDLQIGQVASLSGITPKTIRHYHKIGLLPEPQRADNGYRMYSIQSLYRINLIKSLKQVGFSLSDIKAIIEADNSDDVLHHQLQEILKTIEEQIESLRSRQHQIQKLISSEASLDETRQPGSISTFESLPPSFKHLIENLSPHLQEIETQLYKEIDLLEWGENFEHLLEELSEFLIGNPDFIKFLVTTFETLETLEEDDPQLEQLALDLKNAFTSTPITKLLQESSFYQDKTFFQTFRIITGDKIGSLLSPAQERFFILIEDSL